MSIEINKKKERQQLEQESTILFNEIISQEPQSNAITPVLPTIEDPEDSIIMGNEDLNTITEKETDKVIKSSVEDLVPIPCKSEDTSGSDSEYDLPSCDDFSPINNSEGKSVTFSNPLFDSNGGFTSSDDESLSDEDDIECKVSYDSNFDEPTILVTHLSDECFDPGDDIELLLHHDPSTLKMSIVSILEGFIDELPLEENDNLFDLEFKKNDWKKILYDAPIDDLMIEEIFFDPGSDIDEIDAFLEIDISTDIEDGFYDSEGDVIYLESLLSNDTTPNLPPEEFLDRDPRRLSDINDLKIMVKVFNPGIPEKFFSPTYVSLPFNDLHYLFFTYVIQNFLLYFTYPMDSPFLLSFWSEDTILTPASPLFIFL
uniref:Reverse transcriptase domain-containing protein n=1 Tax=Tanacetum cinerariifolium TaxID=118510 RepID=A0A699GHN3_TANCI|nr:hypothetical protein [Tanacetum cinerariifolium]